MTPASVDLPCRFRDQEPTLVDASGLHFSITMHSWM